MRRSLLVAILNHCGMIFECFGEQGNMKHERVAEEKSGRGWGNTTNELQKWEGAGQQSTNELQKRVGGGATTTELQKGAEGAGQHNK